MGRSGNEPSTARSPLRLRLGLAVFGLLAAGVGVIVSVVVDEPVAAVAFAAVGVVAAVDIGVVLLHIRQGPHYQPGPDVPPYLPLRAADPPPPARARRPRSAGSRQRTYLIMMSICLTLITVSWVWLRVVSTWAAVITSLVAMVIPPIAAIVANAGWDEEAGEPDPPPPPDLRSRG